MVTRLCPVSKRPLLICIFEILTAGFFSPQDSRKNIYRLMNTALGIARLSSHSSLFCPMSLRGSLGIKPQPPVAFPYVDCDVRTVHRETPTVAAFQLAQIYHSLKVFSAAVYFQQSVFHDGVLLRRKKVFFLLFHR